MSVVKSERSSSPFQVLETSIKLRTELYNFGERRFGYKFKERKWETEEQKENRRMYEERFIAKEQETILTLTCKLGLAIAMFNSIYAVIDEEWTERRIWQDRAIGVCADITQELQYIIVSVHGNLEKFIPFQEIIKQEINLIRGVRKYDNKIKNKKSKGNF